MVEEEVRESTGLEEGEIAAEEVKEPKKPMTKEEKLQAAIDYGASAAFCTITGL